MKRLLYLCAGLVLMLALGACATPPPATDAEALQEYQETNDPLEPMNRAVFAFNRGIDEGFLQPAARAYRTAVPAWARNRVGNALDNLSTPVVFFNDILQGEGRRAVTTFWRFILNTTFGVGGLNDFADAIGFEKHDEDFGQSLAVWGAGAGPYLMLPLFGPSNPRDVVGRVVDFLADPFNVWARNTGNEPYMYARGGGVALDLRTELLPLTDDLEKTSLDFYAAVRSLYRQRRADAIGNGAGPTSGESTGVGFGDLPSFASESELSKNP